MSGRTPDTFFAKLKEKVEFHFDGAKQDRTGSSKLVLKSLIQIAITMTLYTILVFFTPVTWIAILLAIFLGVSLAMLGFNVMHEGGHHSFSKHSWINAAAGYMLNALGGTIYFWKVKHNINHHTFTNIEGIDSDIDVRPFMRLHPNQALHPSHRYQHVYCFALYSISYLAWVFYEDFLKYFRGKIAVHMRPMNLPFREHVIFWATKIVYVFVFLALPIIMLGWLKALIGFFIVTTVCGLLIAVVFQLAHVVEGNEFPEGKKIENEWALHQLSTTSNFATSSKLLYWMLGGLNFQIEHHLFPHISHIHYPAIGRLVKNTCAEFNIEYHEYRSLGSALSSHLTYLYKMGQPANG